MKRLTLDKQNAKLIGVCAGIAKYFEVDPTIVRLLFVVGFCCFGLGIVPYILMGLVMPNA